jgi:hypothetical protein
MGRIGWRWLTTAACPAEKRFLVKPVKNVFAAPHKDAAFRAAYPSVPPAFAKLFDWLTRLLLAGLFGLVCFRAATQPIAHDEALAFQMFLSSGVEHTLLFNTVNHVLFTLLAKAFVTVFGVRELSFRAPTVLGSAIYFLATYLLCRRIFRPSAMQFVAVSLLCLNPAILDFMTAARGYGLGMACLAVAMWALAGLTERGTLRPEQKEWRWGCAIASAFLALAVAANVTNIFPAVSLALTFVAIGTVPEFRRSGRVPWKALIKYLVVPGTALGVFILWPFIIQMRLHQFGIGLPTASAMLRDVFNTSFLYKWTGDTYSPSLGAQPPTLDSWQQWLSDAGIYVLLPLLLVVVTAGLFSISSQSSTALRINKAHGQLFCGAAVASVAMIFGLHLILKANYQYSRTTLYAISFFTLGALLTLDEFTIRIRSYALRIICFLLIVAVLCDYVISLNTRYFRYNAYDSISRSLFQTIANDAKSRGLNPVRVGGTWWYEPEMNFYRRRYKADWMMPYEVKHPSYPYQAANLLTPKDYDYFLCTPDNTLCVLESTASFGGKQPRTLFFDPATKLTVFAIEK